jgi:hypothetical protein
MSRFMYIFREGVRPTLSPAELAAHLAKWAEWVDGLTQAGHAEPPIGPLQLEGKTLRGSTRTLTDGPYAEAKDLVTGILVVSADSLDGAVELARGCPIFSYNGSVEVRPFVTTPPGAR